MTGPFPSNNNEGVILNDATTSGSNNNGTGTYQLHQHHPQSYGNKAESTTTITTNIATTPASTTASLHGETKSEDDDDEDDEDEHGVESEPNRGADDSGGDSDPHRNYDTISLTPSTSSMHRRRHGHGHGHSHGHGHGHSHYFHHHSRHRRTPSSSSLASNTLKRGTHNSSGGSGGSCCDYLKVTVSDHQSPKIYVEKCCATGPSDHLDDEVERYFYVHQGSGSRKSSVAHGGGGGGSQYGSHCSLNRSRCGSIRRRRSDHSITTTTADVTTRTPIPQHRSNERVSQRVDSRTISPMMMEFHSHLEGSSSKGHGGRGRASSSGSFHRREDGHYSSNELITNRYTTRDSLCNSVNNRAYFLGDLDMTASASLPHRGHSHQHHQAATSHPLEEHRRAVGDSPKRVKIRCKHHSLEAKDDKTPEDLLLSFYGSDVISGGTFPRSSHGEDQRARSRPHSDVIQLGRGSNSCGSLKHGTEMTNGFSGEIVILTPTKITIENTNNSTMIKFHKSCPTTPELPTRTVDKLPEYACAPSPIQWHFPTSDLSDPTQTTPSEDTTSTEESQTVIQNFHRHQPTQTYGKPQDTKTVSIWRTSENSDEEASAIIFHHESGTVENYSNNYCAYFGMSEAKSYHTNATDEEKSAKREQSQVMNNLVGNSGTGKPDATPAGSLEIAHNVFPAMSTVRDLSHEVRRFQKTSNFEQLNSNNLLSTLERRRQQSDEPILSVEQQFNQGPFVTVLNNHRTPFLERNSHEQVNRGRVSDPLEHSTDIFHSGNGAVGIESGLDLNRIESLARRYNKSSPKPNISLTTQNRFPRPSTSTRSDFGGILRLKRHGLKRKLKRKVRRTQSQESGHDRLLGMAGSDDLLQAELDSINDGVMRNQTENWHQNGPQTAGFWGMGVFRRSVRRLMSLVTKEAD